MDIYKNGDLEEIRQLIDNGSDINEALITCINYRHVDVVKYLMQKGADRKANNYGALKLSIKLNYPEIINLLIITKSDFKFALNYCANDYLETTKILIKNDHDLKNAIYFYVDKGNVEALSYLVKNNDICDKYINGILSHASLISNLEIVKFAIENGASIHHNFDSALIASASNNNLEIVKYLIENGASIHAENDYALRISVENSNVEMVSFLIDNGAFVDTYFNKAIRSSLIKGNVEIIKLLIKNSDNEEIAYNSSLQYCIYSRNKKILDFLLKTFTDIPCDKSEFLCYCLRKNYDDIVHHLLPYCSLSEVKVLDSFHKKLLQFSSKYPILEQYYKKDE